MAFLETVKTLFSGGKIVETIGNVVDELHFSNEEKAKVNQELLKLEAEIEQSYMADTANAREMNSKLQESSNASWLSKNLPYFIDLFILMIWGFMTIYIVLRWLGFIEATKNNVDMTGILGIYSGVTALATMILQFHRGSSQGSQRKTDIIKSSMNNNQ
jgi:hypothetical protein